MDSLRLVTLRQKTIDYMGIKMFFDIATTTKGDSFTLNYCWQAGTAHGGETATSKRLLSRESYQRRFDRFVLESDLIDLDFLLDSSI
jgi:hypothetical protein